MVRELQVIELKKASGMGFEFWKEANLPGKFVPEIWQANWGRMIQTGSGRILGLYLDDGALVGCLGFFVSADINDGAKVATEAFWFVNANHRGAGVKLLLSFLKRAKELGCVRATMVHLFTEQAEQLSQLYKKLGFSPVETHYSKTLI